jgi:integrase
MSAAAPAVSPLPNPKLSLVIREGIRPPADIAPPAVMSREDVAALLPQLRGVEWIMATLLYGAGLRLLECCRLRAKDLDFDRREITVRDGKGGRDRVTLLPERGVAPLATHLERVRRQHEQDLRAGTSSVELPSALERRDPRAAWEWGWQWVFPATRHFMDGRAGDSAGPAGRKPWWRSSLGEQPPRHARDTRAAGHGVSGYTGLSTSC